MSTCIINWDYRRPCKAPWETNGYILIFREPIIAQKAKPMVTSRERGLFLMLWKLTFGLRYAREVKSFTRVLQLISRVKKCVYIDLTSMEMRKKHRKPPQETSLSWYWTRINRGTTRSCNNQVHFDQVNFTIPDYVIRHLMGLFYVCYGKWCEDVWN